MPAEAPLDDAVTALVDLQERAGTERAEAAERVRRERESERAVADAQLPQAQ